MTHKQRYLTRKSAAAVVGTARQVVLVPPVPYSETIFCLVVTDIISQSCFTLLWSLTFFSSFRNIAVSCLAIQRDQQKGSDCMFHADSQPTDQHQVLLAPFAVAVTLPIWQNIAYQHNWRQLPHSLKSICLTSYQCYIPAIKAGSWTFFPSFQLRVVQWTKKNPKRNLSYFISCSISKKTTYKDIQGYLPRQMASRYSSCFALICLALLKIWYSESLRVRYI